MTILNLLNCPGVIIPVWVCQPVQHQGMAANLRGHWDISAVQDLKVAVERIGIERYVIPSTKSHPS